MKKKSCQNVTDNENWGSYSPSCAPFNSKWYCIIDGERKVANCITRAERRSIIQPEMEKDLFLFALSTQRIYKFNRKCTPGSSSSTGHENTHKRLQRKKIRKACRRQQMIKSTVSSEVRAIIKETLYNTSGGGAISWQSNNILWIVYQFPQQ